jgi:hypothetical protein
MRIVPLPARPTPPFDPMVDYAKASVGRIDMQVARTRYEGAQAQHYTGTHELRTSTVTRLDASTLDDAIAAARDLSRDDQSAVAVLQAADGALYASPLRTDVNVRNNPFLNMRGYQGRLSPAAFDQALEPTLRAGYHDYSVEVVRDAGSPAGDALRAVVTDRTVAYA